MKPGRDQSFPRAARLASRDFREVFKSGKRYRTGPFLLYCGIRPDGDPRLGMVVPRQMGKAGVRNRIKRIIREVFRKNRSDIKPGTDLVVRMISGKTVLEYHEIERLLLEGIKSTGMVREQLRTRDEATEEK